MYKRSIIFILIIISFGIIFRQLYFNNIPQQTVTVKQKYTRHILLVPLDSRPPCTKFVIDAGRLANIEVITPPQEIMDYYTDAGDTKKLREWLMTNAAHSDGIIISIDQLLYGGLLSSRQSFGKNTDEDSLWQLLREIRDNNPVLPIYAFNILPRITPPSNIDSAKDIKNLMKYSRLVDKFSQSYDENDLIKIEKLRSNISEKHLEQYSSLYSKNLQLNEKLIDLCADKVITKLVIGQDDGEKYGIPNIEKRSLQRYVSEQKLSQNDVIITHGADEVAMSLLFNMAQYFTDNTYHPKVFVAYNETNAADEILPYMAATVKQIVAEKTALADETIVQSPEEADFILYLHIGNDENLSTRLSETAQLKKWLKENKKIALVDLSRHFLAEETLFPILLANDVPVNQLTAYSGWNTASNSIGTAVAQASLYCLSERHIENTDDALALAYNNLSILYDHFIEDYFYLKGTIDAVNISLNKAGINNVSDLNMDNNYLWANQMLSTSLQRQLDKFAYSKSSRQPVEIAAPDGRKMLYLMDLKVDAFFPWPRTFEIYTNVNFSMHMGN